MSKKNIITNQQKVNDNIIFIFGKATRQISSISVLFVTSTIIVVITALSYTAFSEVVTGRPDSFFDGLSRVTSYAPPRLVGSRPVPPDSAFLSVPSLSPPPAYRASAPGYSIVAEFFFFQVFEAFILLRVYAGQRPHDLVGQDRVLLSLLHAVCLPFVGQFHPHPNGEQMLIYPIRVVAFFDIGFQRAVYRLFWINGLLNPLSPDLRQPQLEGLSLVRGD